MAQAWDLVGQLQEACPHFDGYSQPTSSRKSVVVHFSEGVTEAERAAAQAIVDAFDEEATPPRQIEKSVITERLGGARVLLMEAYFTGGTEDGIMNRERWRDPSHPKVNVNDPRMLGLLMGGVLSLTQAQVDEVLRPYDPTDPNTLDVV